MPTKDMLIILVRERGKKRNKKRKPTFQALCLQQEKQNKKRKKNKKPKPGLTSTRQPDTALVLCSKITLYLRLYRDQHAVMPTSGQRDVRRRIKAMIICKLKQKTRVRTNFE